MSIVILFLLQLLIIVVFQAMTLSPQKQPMGCLKWYGGQRDVHILFFFLSSLITHLPVIPWHPIYTLGSICVLNCIPSKLEQDAPHTQDSGLIPAADTEAMPNHLPEQEADRPWRCFPAPAVMRGQKEKEQSPLRTWGGCQGIKYCSEFSRRCGMTHSSCWSTGKRGAGCRDR